MWMLSTGIAIKRNMTYELHDLHDWPFERYTTRL